MRKCTWQTLKMVRDAFGHPLLIVYPFVQKYFTKGVLLDPSKAKARRKGGGFELGVLSGFRDRV